MMASSLLLMIRSQTAATVLSGSGMECAVHVQTSMSKRAWGPREPLAHCDMQVPGLDESRLLEPVVCCVHPARSFLLLHKQFPSLDRAVHACRLHWQGLDLMM